MKQSYLGGWYLVGLFQDEISIVISPACVEEYQPAVALKGPRHESEMNDAEQAQQDDIHDKEPIGEGDTEMNVLRSTFNEALRTTIQ